VVWQSFTWWQVDHLAREWGNSLAPFLWPSNDIEWKICIWREHEAFCYETMKCLNIRAAKPERDTICQLFLSITVWTICRNVRLECFDTCKSYRQRWPTPPLCRTLAYGLSCGKMFGEWNIWLAGEINQHVELTALWDMPPYSLLEYDRCLLVLRAGEAITMDAVEYIWKFYQLLRDYTALYPRRLSSSHSPPWEPEIS
jgi:hypothetical protein